MIIKKNKSLGIGIQINLFYHWNLRNIISIIFLQQNLGSKLLIIGKKFMLVMSPNKN